MTVPMTGKSARLMRAGIVVSVAAATVVGTATSSSAVPTTVTLSPTSGAVSAVININAPSTTPALFRTAAGVPTLAYTGSGVTAKPKQNAVLFNYAATCPAGSAGSPIPLSVRHVTDGVSPAASRTITTVGDQGTVAGAVKHVLVAGDLVTGTDIQAGTTVVSTTNGATTSVVLSKPMTATHSGDGAITFWDKTAPADAALSNVITNGSTTGDPHIVTSATAAFVDDVIASGGDQGKGVFNNVSGASTIATVDSATQITLAGGVPTAASGIQLSLNTTTSGATLTGPYNAGSVTVVSGTRVVVKAPPVVAATVNKYSVCVYDNTTGAAAGIIANALSGFQIAAAPVITAVTPSSGPALGGNTVVLSVSNLAAGATVTLGGIPMTGTLNTTAGTVTITMPPKTANTYHFQVTSTGGPSALSTGAANTWTDGYTYADGINVTPNTMQASSAAVLDITGTGFSSLTFSDADGTTGRLTDTNAHVFLVDGAYSNITGGTRGSTLNQDKAECANVTVLSDQELICVLDGTSTINSGGATYAGAAVPSGAFTVTIVDSAAAVADAAHELLRRKTIITSTATFTVGAY